MDNETKTLFHNSYIARMQVELDQLKDRAQKLIAFLETETFDDLDEADCELLLAQAGAMRSYAFFLNERLQRATA